MKLPLPADYFKCPPLSPEENDRYTRLAIQNAREMIEKADLTNARYQWKRISDEAELEIFRGKDPYAPAAATLHCAVIDLPGTIDEVANFYRTDTTEEAKELVNRTSNGVLDIVNLYTIQDTPESKIQLQWIVGKGAFDGIVKKRDFCNLEGSLFFPGDDGKRTWVRCLKSLQIPCCPELPKLVRGVQYGSGMICRETHRPGRLELISVVHFNVRGNIPFALQELAAKELCRTMKNVDRYLREDRLSATPFLMGSQFVPLVSRQRCHLCKRGFGPLRKKRNCFKCGEVVCSKCGPLWQVKVAETFVKVRACTTCSLVNMPKGAEDASTVISHLPTDSSEGQSEISSVSEDYESTDYDYDPSVISVSTDDSSMSRYSESTGGVM
ncbi:unnamed protein product, partial [Aphanomyces euteiches]